MGELIADIWHSLRALPLWVQIWTMGILVPVNLASILFIGEADGGWIAFLAIAGIAPNLPVMVIQRGFSRLMAFSHVVFWTPLVIWLILFRPQGAQSYQLYLLLLIAADLISLGFDYGDVVRWWRGERKPAGR